MPIKPENRGRYPANWRAISERIRFDRAGGRCECRGECGLDHSGEGDAGDRCPCRHGETNPRTGATVVLTTAHRPGREPEQCEDEDLLGACQQCHNRLDAPMRAENRRKTLEARKAEEKARRDMRTAVMQFEHECATGKPVAR